MARHLILVILSLTFFACAQPTGTWRWKSTENSVADQRLNEDIRDCEAFFDENHDDIVWELDNGRPYGEWGSFDFEWCMQEHGWNQEFITN